MERLGDCIEELLKFTLESHINETPEVDLGFSKHFCSILLKDDPDDFPVSLPAAGTGNQSISPILLHFSTIIENVSCHLFKLKVSNAADLFKGVPQYPLFKRLASALYQSIVNGVLCKTYDKMAFMNHDISLKQKEENWNKLILEKGTELINVSHHS